MGQVGLSLQTGSRVCSSLLVLFASRCGPAGPRAGQSGKEGGDLRGGRDLQDAVEAVAEEPVGLLDLPEPEAVGEQRGRVEPARLDHRDEPAHPLLAAGAERGDDPVVAETRREGGIRQLELAGVDAQAGQRAAGPERA